MNNLGGTDTSPTPNPGHTEDVSQSKFEIEIPKSIRLRGAIGASLDHIAGGRGELKQPVRLHGYPVAYLLNIHHS